MSESPQSRCYPTGPHQGRCPTEPCCPGVFEPCCPGVFEPCCPGVFEPCCPGVFEPCCPGVFEPCCPGVFEPCCPGVFETFAGTLVTGVREGSTCLQDPLTLYFHSYCLFF
uniref:Uncharacterized protein n=1 Tax=Leptobrachium leishanense TaxID=445787 RepID=A0A8C5MQ13_9ANUR